MYYNDVDNQKNLPYTIHGDNFIKKNETKKSFVCVRGLERYSSKVEVVMVVAIVVVVEVSSVIRLINVHFGC